MSTQKIQLKDGATNLEVASNQTTGNTLICPASTTGTVTIAGGGVTRTGDTNIGDAAQTSGALNARAASIVVSSNTGDTVVSSVAGAVTATAATTAALTGGTTTTVTGGTGATLVATTGNVVVSSTAGDATFEANGTTYLGPTSVGNAGSTTRIANSATSGSLVVGSAQTSGTITIGGNVARTGTISIGSNTGTHATNIRGGSYFATTAQNHTTTVGGDTSLTTVGTTDITGTGDVTVSSGTGDVYVQGAQFTTGSGTLDVILPDGGITVVSGNGYLTAAAGSINVEAVSFTGPAISGASTIGMSGDLTIGGNIVKSTGALSIDATAGDLTVEAGAGNTTYLGSTDSISETRLGNAVDAGTISIGANQLGGLIQIGTNGARSGSIVIGNAAGTQNNTFRGAQNRLQSTGTSYMKTDTGSLTLEATTGAAILTGGTTVTSTSAGATSITSTGGDVTIECGPAGTTYLGAASVANAGSTTRIANSATTGSIVMGTSQVQGTISIGSNVARSGAINIGSGTSTQVNTIRGGENRLLSLDSSYLRASSGTATLEATTGEAIVTGGTDVTVTATTGDVDLVSTAGSVSATAATTMTLTSGGIATIGSTAANTIVAGSVTTSDITIGAAQTTGDILIGTGASRTTGAVIKIGDDGTITTDSVLIKGVEMKKTAGNFTPQLWDFTNSFVHSVQIGTYYRWGNMITYSFTLTWTSKGSASGNIAIGGIPFPQVTSPPSGSNSLYGTIQDLSWTTGSAHCVIRSEPSVQYMRVIKNGAIAQASDFNASGTFRASITLPFVQ